jgi:serine protease Do
MASSLGLTRDSGVIVSDVWPTGPAEAAGLQAGDILVSVDGQPAENLPSVNYNFRLRDSPDKVQLVVLRGSKEVRLSMQAVEQTSDLDSIAAMADVGKNLVQELGILGIEIDEQIVKMASGLRDPYGIIVAARAAGARTEVPLQPRDVIRRLNNTQIFKLEQLRAAVQALKPGSPVTLQIQREGRLMYVSFTFD